MCIVGETESGHGGRFEPCEEYKRLQEENTLAGIEARSVAIAIWSRRYSKEAPNWKPLDTTAGVVSQIDNMTAGLMNDLSRVEAENAALRQERDALVQVSAEVCPECGWAMKFPDEPCRNCEVIALRKVREAGDALAEAVAGIEPTVLFKRKPQDYVHMTDCEKMNAVALAHSAYQESRHAG